MEKEVKADRWGQILYKCFWLVLSPDLASSLFFNKYVIIILEHYLHWFLIAVDIPFEPKYDASGFAGFILLSWLYVGWSRTGGDQAKENAGANGSTWRGNNRILFYFDFLSLWFLCILSSWHVLVNCKFTYRVVVKVPNSRKLKRRLKGGLICF